MRRRPSNNRRSLESLATRSSLDIRPVISFFQRRRRGNLHTKDQVGRHLSPQHALQRLIINQIIPKSRFRVPGILAAGLLSPWAFTQDIYFLVLSGFHGLTTREPPDTVEECLRRGVMCDVFRCNNASMNVLGFCDFCKSLIAGLCRIIAKHA